MNKFASVNNHVADRVKRQQRHHTNVGNILKVPYCTRFHCSSFDIHMRRGVLSGFKNQKNLEKVLIPPLSSFSLELTTSNNSSDDMVDFR